MLDNLDFILFDWYNCFFDLPLSQIAKHVLNETETKWRDIETLIKTCDPSGIIN